MMHSDSTAQLSRPSPSLKPTMALHATGDGGVNGGVLPAAQPSPIRHRPYTATQRLLKYLRLLFPFCNGDRWLSKSGSHNDVGAMIDIIVETDEAGRQVVYVEDRHAAAKYPVTTANGTTTATSSSVMHSTQLLASQTQPAITMTDQDRHTFDELMNVLQEYRSTIQQLPPALTQRFSVRALLGWGGNGFVMHAHDRVLNMPVAIKAMPKANYQSEQQVATVDADPSIASAIATSAHHSTGDLLMTDPDDESGGDMPWEIWILKQLRHPNIVRYVAHFEDAMNYYLVMERVSTFNQVVKHVNGAGGTTTRHLPRLPKILRSSTFTRHHRTSITSILSKQPSLIDTASLSSSRHASGMKRPLRSDNGSLYHLLQTRPADIAQPHIYKRLFCELVMAYREIDKLGALYLDFKCENVLVVDRSVAARSATSHEKLAKDRGAFGKFFRPTIATPTAPLPTPEYSIKLIDFGMARLKPQPGYKLTTYGTRWMSAPEVLLGRGCSGQEGDLWALGLILYTMATGGQDAFYNYEEEVAGMLRVTGPGDEDAFEVVREWQPPASLTDDSTRQILARLLHPHPRQRATLPELLLMVSIWAQV